MAGTADVELRATIAAGLERLNRDRGGRHLGRVADALGVNRSSVSRWLNREASPTFERCMELVTRYPGYFDRSLLVELHTRAALGETARPGSETVTILQRGTTPAETHAVLAESLEREPAAPADRELLHASLEVDTAGPARCPGIPSADAPGGHEAERYLRALRDRAEEGWRIRLVANAGTPLRLAALEALVRALDGPDVEIRGYPVAVPHVVSQIVVARRDVFLARGGPSAGSSAPALLHLVSPEAVAWSTRYVDTLFNEAPFRLRTPRGVSDGDLARLRALVGAR